MAIEDLTDEGEEWGDDERLVGHQNAKRQQKKSVQKKGLR